MPNWLATSVSAWNTMGQQLSHQAYRPTVGVGITLMAPSGNCSTNLKIQSHRLSTDQPSEQAFGKFFTTRIVKADHERSIALRVLWTVVSSFESQQVYLDGNLSINIALELKKTFCSVLGLTMYRNQQWCEPITLRPQSDQQHSSSLCSILTFLCSGLDPASSRRLRADSRLLAAARPTAVLPYRFCTSVSLCASSRALRHSVEPVAEALWRAVLPLCTRWDEMTNAISTGDCTEV